MLFILCCNIAEHFCTKHRVWNRSIKVHSCFEIIGHVETVGHIEKMQPNCNKQLCSSKIKGNILCVNKNEEIYSTDSRGCTKAGGFQISNIIRPIAASMHIFLAQNRDKLFFWKFHRLVRIKLKLIWSYFESEGISILGVATCIC